MTQHNGNEKLREAALVKALNLLEMNVRTKARDDLAERGLIMELRALLAPTPTWQAHEPVEGAVAPNEATYGLLRDGTVMKAEDIGVWDNCADVDYDAQVIAFCISAEPPAKDTEGYYKHDGSEVAPVSGRVDADFVEVNASVENCPAHRANWSKVTRWRPVGAE